MKPEVLNQIIDLMKWLGTAAIAVFGLLKAWQSYLKENSAGATKIKEFEAEMKELKKDFREVIMSSMNRK